MAIIRKKTERKINVRSVRQPSSLAEMGDTSFGETTLSNIQDGYLLSYNSDTDKFDLVSADDLLAISAEDQDISDPFVTQLEKELDLEDVTDINLDGGSF
jgi:hypothetical protein